VPDADLVVFEHSSHVLHLEETLILSGLTRMFLLMSSQRRGGSIRVREGRGVAGSLPAGLDADDGGRGDVDGAAVAVVRLGFVKERRAGGRPGGQVARSDSRRSRANAVSSGWAQGQSCWRRDLSWRHATVRGVAL
jgi:hypothetical protein